MKKSKFSDKQIVFALKQAESGTRVSEICRKFGICEATFYSWKKKFGGMSMAELLRLCRSRRRWSAPCGMSSLRIMPISRFITLSNPIQ